MNALEIFMSEITKMAKLATPPPVSQPPAKAVTSSAPVSHPVTSFSPVPTLGATGILPQKPAESQVKTTKTMAQSAKVAENVRTT